MTKINEDKRTDLKNKLKILGAIGGATMLSAMPVSGLARLDSNSLSFDGKYVPTTHTGTSAPDTTPTRVGDVFIDTTNKIKYTAVGTDSSSDWKGNSTTITVAQDGSGDYTTIQDALSKLGSNSGKIFIKKGTYNLSSSVEISSGQYLEGEGRGATILNFTTAGAIDCITNRIYPSRIYRVGVSSMTIRCDSILTNRNGINFTKISFGSFRDIEFNNFDKAMIGSGLNYYNEWYNMNPTSCNYALYCDGASNEQHFYGGSWKNHNIAQVYIELTNNINFVSVAFEGTDQVINLDTGARQINFTDCRFEFLGSSSTFTTHANSYGINIKGGFVSGLLITDNGVGNFFLVGDVPYQLNHKLQSKTGLSIIKTGSGMTDATPTLYLEESYSPSGTGTNIKCKNPRFGGKFISCIDNSNTELFSVGAWKGQVNCGKITSTDDFDGVNAVLSGYVRSPLYYGVDGSPLTLSGTNFGIELRNKALGSHTKPMLFYTVDASNVEIERVRIENFTDTPNFRIDSSTKLKVNEINETTTNSGVTIDGVLIKDGTVAVSPTISSGTGAPATTPAKVGDIFIDTTNGNMYFAKGTTDSDDWVRLENFTP